MPFGDNHRSLPDILRDLVSQLTTLVRMESQLARAEISEKIGKAVGGIVLVVLGAVLLIPALVVLLEAAVAGMIDAGLEAHWSALIVGGIALAIGVVLLLVGVNRFKTERFVPVKTIGQLQQDVSVAKHQMRHEHDTQRAA